MTQISHW